MPTTLKSATLPALVLEIAENLRIKEAALTPAQNRVTISYGSSANNPRLVQITASLPYTQTRVAADGGTKLLFNDYAPDALTLTGTPLAAEAAEGLAEALAIACEELDAAERAAIAAGETLPTGVGTDISYANLEASITCTLPYAMVFNADGQPVPTVTNYIA